MHGDLRVELLRLLVRHQRLVHGVLAQFREVALELRQVVVPRVLAHLVERARDRAVVSETALPLISRIYFFKGCNLVLNFRLSKSLSLSLSLSFSISVLNAKILILIFH